MSEWNDRSDSRRVKAFYRSCCTFISLCGLVSLIGIFVYGIPEDVLATFVLTVVHGVALYAFGNIALTGRPPKALAWLLNRT